MKRKMKRLVGALTSENSEHVPRQIQKKEAVLKRRSLNVYYTDTGVSIDKSVELGNTVLFQNEFKAIAYAKLIRSYKYSVYDVKGNFIRWAVPK